MTTNRRTPLVALAIVMLLTAVPSMSQEAPSPQGRELDKLWGDLLHYIKIAQPQLAQSYGQAILEYPGLQAKQLYLLQQKTPKSAAVLGRGANMDGMSVIVVELRKLIEKGYQELRSEPKEIAASIKQLGSTLQGSRIAGERLKISGEYALPQLLQALGDTKTPIVLRERIVVLLGRMGKEAVRPLSAALQSSNPQLQKVIASALGQIQYSHAAPRLKELIEREGVLQGVKVAARRALTSCLGSDGLEKTSASLFYDFALKYYYQQESVSPDIRQEKANVWYWRNDRLAYTPVPREIFCAVYAMRMCRLALQHDASFYSAVSLWVAANLNRQANLPEGATDATYGDETPEPNYFTLASSAKYLQAVLKRGLNDENSPVALGAIQALAQTAGAKNLVQPVEGGAQPLVQALSYSDRHVRFLAAVSLANALPDKQFTGDDMVMTQLVHALRQTGQKTALLVVADENRRNQLKAILRSADYEVIDAAAPDDAIAAAITAAGVDVAVLSSSPAPVAMISRFRQNPSLVTLPAVVFGRNETLRALAKQDGRTVLLDAKADEEQLDQALAQASALAGGEEMDAEQAAAWTIRAAKAVERLADTGNLIFNVELAESSLIALLASEREEVLLAAADALAVMQSTSAQQAIAAVAVGDETPENIRIAAFNDLSASLRRFGNQLTEVLSQQVVDIVGGEGSPELLNAAAQALGAMDLPSDQIKSLILKTGN